MVRSMVRGKVSSSMGIITLVNGRTINSMAMAD